MKKNKTLIPVERCWEKFFAGFSHFKRGVSGKLAMKMIKEVQRTTNEMYLFV